MFGAEIEGPVSVLYSSEFYQRFRTKMRKNDSDSLKISAPNENFCPVSEIFKIQRGIYILILNEERNMVLVQHAMGR